MRFKPTGQVLHTAAGYSARVRVGAGANDRECFTLAVNSDEAAEERAALLASMASMLRPHASADDIRIILEEAGNARTPADLAETKEAADAIANGETEKASSALSPTFEKFAEEWTTGKLRKAHPDHVREKDSTGDEALLRLHINPRIGRERIGDVKLEHCERVMRGLPSELSPGTRRQVAQCMRKILSFAVYPGKYLALNPIPREWMPKVPKGASKAKACLWPSEDAKLLRCKAVPFERRLAYGILVREGLRASELECLRWRDVDLVHGGVRLDKNKTADPRAWALSPDVARTLVWWKKRRQLETQAETLEALDGELVLGLDLGDGAWWLRGDEHFDPAKPVSSANRPGDLRTAGITRAELFERSKVRQPLRLHDLRASFVTISLANGRTESRVSSRTGHRSSQMLALYTRQARTWSELGLGTLGPLDELLPEMATRARGPRDAKRRPPSTAARRSASPAPSTAPLWAAFGQRKVGPVGFEPTTYGLKEGDTKSSITAHRENGSIVDVGSPEIGGGEMCAAQRMPNGAGPGGSDAELVDGILAALRGGLADVARVLGAELEERQRTRVPENVVRLPRRGRP